MLILNTYIETVPNTIGGITLCICILSFVAAIVATIELATTDHNVLAILCFILAISLFIFLILILNNNVPFTYDEVTHYEITIDDYYPLSLLLRQFDVIEVHGRILD